MFEINIYEYPLLEDEFKLTIKTINGEKLLPYIVNNNTDNLEIKDKIMIFIKTFTNGKLKIVF